MTDWGLKMKYRRFGKTELSMPVISCGGMRYQDQWNDMPWEKVPRAGQENIERVLAHALENGINHIETARGYGSSEMQLGYALKLFPRESYILQTKVGPEDKPKDFLRKFETSMNYLQVDQVDLFALHGLNNRESMDRAMRPGGCLEAAQKLKADGRVRHIGFSTHAATHEIIELIESGQLVEIVVSPRRTTPVITLAPAFRGTATRSTVSICNVAQTRFCSVKALRPVSSIPARSRPRSRTPTKSLSASAAMVPLALRLTSTACSSRTNSRCAWRPSRTTRSISRIRLSKTASAFLPPCVLSPSS